MRGKRCVRCFSIVSYRITPADAGKTILQHTRQQAEQDHPRGCGENVSPSTRYSRPSGSPPRMRGKPDGVAVGAALERITHADAGKTKTWHGITSIDRDHPRGCGENVFHLYPIPYRPGSPPRMRGKLHQILPVISAPRITPADAGKTLGGGMIVSGATDHPRGCGENIVTDIYDGCKSGSPPRMRGKPIRSIHLPSFAGITPADAGKTFG